MYLLLIVLQALCELVNRGGLAPQLEPVRRAPEEPEGPAGRDPRRAEPSLCSAFDVAPSGEWTGNGNALRPLSAPVRAAWSPGILLRRSRRD